uniref:NADP-dependent oxidoreductase domain-containing protein n=1 Tax=Kalanchoe fedtschenkoi TaxID=63787 RepID=A0A7N0VD92_KALFE
MLIYGLPALQMGYRHFDTATIYGSETAVGRALTDSLNSGNAAAVDRSEVFLTSKLWGSDHHDPVSALLRTLENVGMEYVDLYLVHWPVKLKPGGCSPLPVEEDFEALEMETTWEGMQRCLEMGLCRSIGVSNFSSRKVQQLLDYASVYPAVNQVEMHPMWRQGKLRKFCKDNNIHISAYSPLGGPGNCWGSKAVVEHPIIKSIALKHRATPAQVSLKWGMSMGASTIVKSFNEERMVENMGALHVDLEEWDLIQIERIEEVKIMKGEFLVNKTTSPYKSIQDLWDDEI